MSMPRTVWSTSCEPVSGDSAIPCAPPPRIVLDGAEAVAPLETLRTGDRTDADSSTLWGFPMADDSGWQCILRQHKVDGTDTMHSLTAFRSQSTRPSCSPYRFV